MRKPLALRRTPRWVPRRLEEPARSWHRLAGGPWRPGAPLPNRPPLEHSTGPVTTSCHAKDGPTPFPPSKRSDTSARSPRWSTEHPRNTRACSSRRPPAKCSPSAPRTRLVTAIRNGASALVVGDGCPAG